MANTPFSEAALKLILESEGLDQPSKWPGKASGITIGFGDDLGYQSVAEFTANWQPVLAPEAFKSLLDAIGKTGATAHAMAHKFSGIHVTRAQAKTVFMGKTLPTYINRTRHAFAGFDRLPLDAQGALVSLVYNRGTGMTDSHKHPGNRKEMRAIRDEVAKPRASLAVIAEQLRSMKRLWVGQGVDGLVTRREAEAKLVEHADRASPVNKLPGSNGKQGSAKAP